MPRFYLRKLRSELAGDGRAAEGHDVALLEPQALPLAAPAATEAAEAAPAVAPAEAEPKPAPRRRRTRRDAAAEAIAIEAILTEDVATVTGVLTPEQAAAIPQDAEAVAASVVDQQPEVWPPETIEPRPETEYPIEAVAAVESAEEEQEATEDLDEAYAEELAAESAYPIEAVADVEAAAAEQEQAYAEGAAAESAAAHRRRRRGRGRGRSLHATETTAAEAAEPLPGEPALSPETVEYGEGYVPEVPPSSHLNELVRSGALVLPERGRGRRHRGRGGAVHEPEAEPQPATTEEPAARLPAAPGHGARGRLSTTDELLARQNVLFDRLLEQQTAMARTLDRLLTLAERGGSIAGGGGGGPAYMPKVAVFVDVPNIVYAADRIGVAIDWGKVLQYITRDRQLVRATAYAPVSDDPYQRVESQRFVQPFYNLPYRILTKPMKRFGNGEIKANFDVELAIDAIAMADRLDVVCLVSGDGDFRRMVELVQAKGVRVEVMAFGSSTAGELRAVCDDYIDMGNRVAEFKVTR